MKAQPTRAGSSAGCRVFRVETTHGEYSTGPNRKTVDKECRYNPDINGAEIPSALMGVRRKISRCCNTSSRTFVTTVFTILKKAGRKSIGYFRPAFCLHLSTDNAVNP